MFWVNLLILVLTKIDKLILFIGYKIITNKMKYNEI